jgi:hypothetical protein
MAILYSYPHATPALTDMVLGAKIREDEGISTNSFYVYDLINLMQTTTVVYEGDTPLTEETLNELYPNAMIGFKVQGIHAEVLTMYEKSALSYLWISYPITVL